jgi:hypothetical protein
MSSLFLNGLYTSGISALSETTNLLLGGTNTNNIQILTPIMGNSANNITFSSLNTTDIINTITQNYCFNSIVPSALLSVTNNSTTKDTTLLLDSSNIILDATNITLNATNITLNTNNSNRFNSFINNFNSITMGVNEYITMGSPNNTVLPILNQLGYKQTLLTMGGTAITGVSPTPARISNFFTIPKGTWIIDICVGISNNTSVAVIGISQNGSIIDPERTTTIHAGFSGTTVQQVIVKIVTVTQYNTDTTTWCVNGYKAYSGIIINCAANVYATRIA